MFGPSLHGSTIMRKFRLSILAPLVAFAALPTAYAANCYSVYDAQNRGRIDWSRFPEWAWPTDPEVFTGHEG